jgi:putative addiction module killer protein
LWSLWATTRLGTRFARISETATVRHRNRIQARLLRLQAGLTGDAHPVGEGVSELRIHHGPGYRVYFVQRGKMLVILLCSGDKSTQDRDIARAKEIALGLQETDP